MRLKKTAAGHVSLARAGRSTSAETLKLPENWKKTSKNVVSKFLESHEMKFAMMTTWQMSGHFQWVLDRRCNCPGCETTTSKADPSQDLFQW